MPILLLLLLLIWVPLPLCAASLSLDVRGLEGDLDRTIRESLVLPELVAGDDRFNRQRLGAWQRRLPGLVREILEPYGYFYSSVQSRLEMPAAEEFRLVIEVDAGEPLRLTSVQVKLLGEGREHAALQQQVDAFPLKAGDTVRQDYYEQGKGRLRQEAMEAGYLDADFSRHQLLVHLAERRADIDLALDTGPRYFFGATEFLVGTYPQAYLERFVAYRQKEPFSYSLLGKTQIDLMDADLFGWVRVEAQPEKAVAGEVPVVIEATPLPRHRLRPGVGYGTDTGARVSLQYRLLNIADRAHEFQGELMLAEWRQTLETTYIIPQKQHADSVTLVRLGIDREDIDSFYRLETFAEAQYRRNLGRGYSGALFMRLMSERSRIAATDNRARLLLPGLRFGRQRLDHPLTPTRGYQAQLELVGSDARLLSDTSLVQLSINVAGVQPLRDTLSLIYRFKGGTTWHRDAFREVPVSLRYFAGGDRSVRGYKYNSLGPENSEGEIVGGKHLLEMSLELERKLLEKWSTAIFYDAGNAFDQPSNFEIKQGAGIGVRYHTPIGAIRLDLARQIGEATNRLRLHLSVGGGW